MSSRRPLTSRLILPALGVAVIALLLLTAERKPAYRAGQCTQSAYDRRPDLTRGTDGLDAADWARWARENGYRVDGRPEAGAVAVWGRNVGGAGPDGRCAYVERVTPDGAVFVSERNWDGCPDLSYVRLTPPRLSTALFIHR